MIECLPRSLCSRDFSVGGLSTGPAVVEYDWLTEQGRIVSGPMGYEICKHGMLSGRWTLEQGGMVVAEAHKPSAMFRCFEIECEAMHFTIQARSSLTRAFEIIVDEHVVGSIRPAHAFTRRATIECPEIIPERIQLFAFWLVGLTWRRSASTNAGVGT